MTQYGDQALLVTGAGGQLGRLAVEELLARGATRVIAGTRDPETLSDLAARGVEVRKIDFDDGQLAAALAGVERMLLISTVAANRTQQQRAAVAAAKAAGVQHIVYTSAPNPRPNASVGGIADHYWTEQAIAGSGIAFTILRNHIYAEAVLMGLEGALASGQLFDATAGKGRAYVSRLDCARTAAGALLQAEGSAIFDVTGPAPVTQTEVAELLSQLTGKTITRVGLTPDQLRGGMLEAGLPPFMANLLVAFDADAAQGHHAIVADTVAQFSGREPQALAAVLAEHRQAFAG
ncbi:MAG: NAD(P)-dependent oxidoreductase [Devosia sp.]|nr:NAD(P)-dependent oxidoreductase [Devosia sp.]